MIEPKELSAEDLGRWRKRCEDLCFRDWNWSLLLGHIAFLDARIAHFRARVSELEIGICPECLR